MNTFSLLSMWLICESVNKANSKHKHHALSQNQSTQTIIPSTNTNKQTWKRVRTSSLSTIFNTNIRAALPKDARDCIGAVKGFTLRYVEAQGNCSFLCMSLALFGTTNRSRVLRHLLAFLDIDDVLIRCYPDRSPKES